jgi:hypothetical protein
MPKTPLRRVFSTVETTACTIYYGKGKEHYEKVLDKSFFDRPSRKKTK